MSIMKQRRGHTRTANADLELFSVGTSAIKQGELKAHINSNPKCPRSPVSLSLRNVCFFREGSDAPRNLVPL